MGESKSYEEQLAEISNRAIENGLLKEERLPPAPVLKPRKDLE